MAIQYSHVSWKAGRIELWGKMNESEQLVDKLESGLRKDITALTLWNLAISLEFGGMMHITIRHIANEDGLAGPILARSTELWIFGDRDGSGQRYDVTTLIL